MKAEFDHPTRARRYRQANLDFPAARRIEIERTIELVNAHAGDRILEYGCGSGVLTRELSKRVARSGRVHALDNSRESMDELFAKPAYNIVPAVVGDSALSIPNESVDAIVSLANFHHVKNKLRLLREFYRAVRPGGRVVIVDVADGTDVQKFFDSAVDAFCSTGHKHRFLNAAWARNLLDQAGFEAVSWEISDVPWKFASESDAKQFVHTIFDATCSLDECWQQTRQFLNATMEDCFCLEWQLAFLTARKPALGSVACAAQQSNGPMLAMTA